MTVQPRILQMTPAKPSRPGPVDTPVERRRMGAALHRSRCLYLMLFGVLLMPVFLASAGAEDPKAERHYTLFRKGDGHGNTLLVIGGIHGDEPGGYFAAMLLGCHYTFRKGSVWVVPNLNFDSIVAGRRGIYGDMNRKFLRVDPHDRDAAIVRDIQDLMVQPGVDLVLNLHDGHGFYREERVNDLFNPSAWGQACIIDQTVIPGVRFGNLKEIAARINGRTNVSLREDVHAFNTKNTRTPDRNREMQNSLTYFAIRHQKPAFAIETSKNITDLSLKVFYQLRTIESFLDILGIACERDFDLSQEGIAGVLEDKGQMVFAGGRVVLPLSNLRDRIRYFPVCKAIPDFVCDNPLVALVREPSCLQVMNGNRPVTRLYPEQVPADNSLDALVVKTDKRDRTVALGTVLAVRDVFEIQPLAGYRVNVIGFQKEGLVSETGVPVRREDIPARFSLDRDGHVFRVEVYRGPGFCGMVLMDFSP